MPVVTIALLSQIIRNSWRSTCPKKRVSPGGPATNAAVAFAYLAGRSTLCAAIGRHRFTSFIKQEMNSYGVDIVDLSAASNDPPPFSSIITTKNNGERSVVTFTAGKATAEKSDLPKIDVGAFDILLVDGFHMPVSQLIAARAREKAVPVVLDGGSWKKGG